MSFRIVLSVLAVAQLASAMKRGSAPTPGTDSLTRLRGGSTNAATGAKPQAEHMIDAAWQDLLQQAASHPADQEVVLPVNSDKEDGDSDDPKDADVEGVMLSDDGTGRDNYTPQEALSMIEQAKQALHGLDKSQLATMPQALAGLTNNEAYDVAKDIIKDATNDVIKAAETDSDSLKMSGYSDAYREALTARQEAITMGSLPAPSTDALAVLPGGSTNVATAAKPQEVPTEDVDLLPEAASHPADQVIVPVEKEDAEDPEDDRDKNMLLDKDDRKSDDPTEYTPHEAIEMITQAKQALHGLDEAQVATNNEAYDEAKDIIKDATTEYLAAASTDSDSLRRGGYSDAYQEALTARQDIERLMAQSSAGVFVGL